MAQNDQFFISHRHRDEDGLPNLEELTVGETVQPDNASTSSVVHTPPFVHAKRLPQTVLFSNEVRFLEQKHSMRLKRVGSYPAHHPHG